MICTALLGSKETADGYEELGPAGMPFQTKEPAFDFHKL